MVATQQQNKWHRRIVIAGVILVAAGVVGYVAYDFWSVHKKTQAILGAPGIIAESDNQNAEKADEGVETTPVVKEDLSGYKVEADQPRIISIEKLNLEARVRPLGLNSDNSIKAPKNIYDAGWYTGSAKPGQAGAMFIDGHASGSTRQGLFGYLNTLKVGDTVGLEKGDGEKLTYKVVKVSTVPLTAIDMSSILAPYPGVENGLNLMTCTGRWIKDSATLDHRVIVYTQQV